MNETEARPEKEADERIFPHLVAGQVWNSTEHHRRPRSVVVYRWAAASPIWPHPPAVEVRTISDGEVFRLGEEPPPPKDGQKAPRRWVRADTFERGFVLRGAVPGSALPTRALTVLPPWPSFIFADDLPVVPGRKVIENRGRTPPVVLLNRRLLIHTGRSYDEGGAAWIAEKLGLKVPRPEECHPGCVVGAVTIVGWVPAPGARRPRANLPEGVNAALIERNPWLAGPVGWLLADPVRLQTPVPARGQQTHGWKVPPDILAAVHAQL